MRRVSDAEMKMAPKKRGQVRFGTLLFLGGVIPIVPRFE
jgi:hypothetical protein